MCVCVCVCVCVCACARENTNSRILWFFVSYYKIKTDIINYYLLSIPTKPKVFY